MVKTLKKIKVIHIYKDFDIYNGLLETFMIMANNFNRQLFDFKVCVFKYRGSIHGKKFCQLGGHLDDLNVSWEDSPLIIWKLYKYLKREKPHIVQTYVLKPNLYGRIAAKIAGVPVIISTELTLKNQAPSRIRRFRDMFLHPVNGVINNFTDVIVCASKAIKKEWEDGRIDNKLKVIYPPFDIQKSPEIKRQNIKKAHYTIGIAGRLSEEKRHVDLFRAFRNILKIFHDTRLLIAGEGPLREYLEVMARRLNIERHVSFLGFQNNIFEFLKEIDIFILPSRSEGAGLSILEAMYTGLPVIATNVGGIPEIVINEVTGLLVPAENPEALSEAIIRLLSNPDLMQKMGENGRHRVLTHFNPENFIKAHENLYIDLLSKKGYTIVSSN